MEVNKLRSSEALNEGIGSSKLKDLINIYMVKLACEGKGRERGLDEAQISSL